MTLANKITLLRIVLIPVFVGLALYYASSVERGMPDERLRIAAIVVFAIASLSDALDGWIARHYKQQSRLGVILDPLADKLLMISAVCVLSFSAWPHGLPLYLVILSLSREVLTIAGAFVVKFVAGKVEVQPHWTGKMSTLTSILAVAAAMLSLGALVPWVSAVAAFFVATSSAVYFWEGVKQVTATGHGNADT